MAKYDVTTLSNLSSNPGSAQTNINTERAAVSTAIELLLSRDGASPNTMEADLDMNSNSINNAASITGSGVLTMAGKTIAAWEWQGAWVTSTAYVLNDIVSNNSSSYICILAHTSGATDDEPGVGAVTTTYWNPIALQGATGATGATGAAGADGTDGEMAAAVYDPTTVAGDAFDTDNHVDGSTNHVFTAADDTKLTGIEALADVTDVTNVTTAGALMDSEVTDLTGIKAIDTTDILFADVGDTLTAGYASDVKADGTKSSGTYTPAVGTGDENLKSATNGGAHTLAPMTTNGTVIIQYTNDASAGAITTTGFDIVTGDAFTTTDGDDFLCFLTVIGTFQHLHVVALQ